MKKVSKLESFINRAPTEGPRVLVADIETFPMEGYFWGLFKQNISLDMIKENSKVMSFAGKWLGDKAYYYIDNRSRGNPRDDVLPLSASYHILQHTDFVIAHNGQYFDMRKLRARYAEERFAPLPVIPVIDTLLQNRKAFAFDSQKLAFVTGLVGAHEKDEHSEFPGFKLWAECLKDNPRAWKANEKYNVMDIVSNEDMYMDLRGWYQGAPNFGPFYPNAGEDEHRCPGCGSVHVMKKGLRRTQVGIYQRYQCDDCGQWSRGRFLVVGKNERSHILIN